MHIQFTERRKVIWSEREYEPQDKFGSLHHTRLLGLLVNILPSSLGYVYLTWSGRGDVDINCSPEPVYVAYISSNYKMLLINLGLPVSVPFSVLSKICKNFLDLWFLMVLNNSKFCYVIGHIPGICENCSILSYLFWHTAAYKRHLKSERSLNSTFYIVDFSETAFFAC